MAEARHLAEELRKGSGLRSNDKQPLGLPFEERRLRSALSFHARQVFDMPQ